ncbi:MAG: helicase-related protein, partial [Rhodospirillales bacterium]
LIKQLVPEAEFLSRPRFSTLTYTGAKKITRLPPRSAVVAFSTAEVYTIAELIRRQRGGAAVVLGALSPRTRNAQVEIYQNGDVDYLVATDAIGMGLNMDVDHVSFAETRKFDGRHVRHLQPAELAQIAGRAGRHMNNGTFGTAADINLLDAETIEQIENHDFEPLDQIHWRNPRLNFNSIEALQKSLSWRPDIKGLVKSRKGDDEIILQNLAGDLDIANMTTQPDTVRLLWEVCQIPDFGGVLSDAHARLLARLYRYLMADGAGIGRLPHDWIATQVSRTERADGDIETLVQRIANIRTWTYIAHRADWLDDAAHWQARTRQAEDKLSDALHDKLTQRFVDRRSAHLVSRLKDGLDLLAAVKSSGEVIVEGHAVGHLKGFKFATDTDGVGAAAKAVSTAAVKALRSEIPRRLRALETTPAESLTLTDDGLIQWHGHSIGRLTQGSAILKPAIEPLPTDLLDAEQLQRLRRSLLEWLSTQITHHLAPLIRLQPNDQAGLSGAARGLVFQLAEGLGSLPRVSAHEQIQALKPQDRKTLRKLGLTIGRHSLYLSALLKPTAVKMRRQLWLAFHRSRLRPALPHPGRVSLMRSESIQPAYFEAIGYRPFKTIAIRVDVLERLAKKIWALTQKSPAELPVDIQAMSGCNFETLSEIVVALGYRRDKQEDHFLFSRTPRLYRKLKTPQTRRPPKQTNHSPFAKLNTLKTKG